MEFKNETEENIKYRIGDYKTGFEWYTIRPGEVADIPWKSAKNLPLTKLTENETKPNEDPKDAGAGFQEETEQDDLATYRKKLIDIKGVGPKSAKEIIKTYPTEKILKEAIAEGQEIHKHDGIDEAVKIEFS